MTDSAWQQMEAFSDAWLAEMADILAPYSEAWVLDSFHWWSRVWEYPWTLAQVVAVTPEGGKILDLGAGVSFFPYYVQDHLQNSTLVAADYDDSFPALYSAINARSPTAVHLTTTDARSEDSPDLQSGVYDTVYSISVATSQFLVLVIQILHSPATLPSACTLQSLHQYICLCTS